VEPDLVHLHSAKAGLAGRLSLRGARPTVYQPHAWSFLAAEGVVERGALSWERRAARWSDAIVCVSGAEREQGIAAGVRAPWEVVPNGVDLERFRPRNREEARWRLELGGAPLVVCVGRLSRQKGQDLLLKAWPAISVAAPEARLALVGTGPDEAKLRAGAPRGVSFAGATDDVPSWLAAADIVVLPSRWEGMSLSMLEGMASGRSVVISDVPGAREAVTAGVGAVVAVEDVAGLSRAVLERLKDPALREREGAEARKVAEGRFGLDKALRATAEVYERVLTRRAAARSA
jgi:glycosyltransferase involved in cell wall biosynthesis